MLVQSYHMFKLFTPLKEHFTDFKPFVYVRSVAFYAPSSRKTAASLYDVKSASISS